MRCMVVAALAALVALSGCASPESETAVVVDDPLLVDPSTGESGNATLPLMRFAAGDQETTLPFEVTFGATDFCVFTGNICSSAVKRVDLTAAIPAAVPVELAIEVTGFGNFGLQLETSDATLLQYDTDYDSGTYRLDASLVRAASGTVALAIHYYLPSLDNPQDVTLTGLAHATSRSDVVPAFVPVAMELGPGDVLNVTGDGLEQVVVFPPKGEPLRATLRPFEIHIPMDYPSGTYLAVADADEAVRIRGPDRPLSAHLLVYTATEPVDIPMGQPVEWPMPVEGHALRVGLVLRTKPTADGSAVAAFPGNFAVKVTSPANVDVLSEEQACTPLVTCGMAVLGYSSYGYVSDLLDEHLVLGTYQGSVAMETGRDMQAYSWSLTIS